MPKFYRSMKKDQSDKPIIGDSAITLGVRGPEKVVSDVDVDEHGDIKLNKKGMSVAPHLSALQTHRIPKRLKNKFPDARGPKDIYCFTMGNGLFQDEDVTEHLTLIVDRPKHGVIAPYKLVSLASFRSHLAETKDNWVIDEE